jgi:hypothetical protein
MKKACAIGVLALMISGILFAQSAPPGNAVVQGTVQRLDSSEPVRGAFVELRPGRGAEPLIVTADEAGLFAFKSVPPGEYTLAATHPGYVRTELGQRKLNGPGARITLKPGQEMKAVTLSLAATAVISGQIRGVKGLPAANVQVHALKYGYEEGRRVLQTIRAVRTDDNGDYRLFWLPPGQYTIMAIPLLGGVEDQLRIPGPDGTARGFRSTQPTTGKVIVLPQENGTTPFYYPGTIRVDGAAAITLKSGEERSRVDFNLTTLPSLHVRGTITNLPPVVGGNAAGPPTMASVRLEPTTPSILERKTAPTPGGFLDLRTGAFDIRGVAPGSYNLIASAASGGRNRTSTFARVPLEVTGNDIDNLRVTLAPSFNVTARVRVEGASDNAAEVTKLMPLRIAFNGYVAQPDPSQPDTFIAELRPDVYRIRVDALRNGYMKFARFGDFDIPDTGLALSSAPSTPVEITISLSAGAIMGKAIERDGQPAFNAAVVLAPDPPRRKQANLYKNVFSGADGSFQISGVAPGDYKLFSWIEVDAGAWQDPEFIKNYEEEGKSVHIDEGTAASMEVVAIP